MSRVASARPCLGCVEESDQHGALPQPADLGGRRRRDLDHDVASPRIAESRSGGLVQLVGDQRAGSGPGLDHDLDPVAEPPHDVRHERDATLAGRALLRDADGGAIGLGHRPTVSSIGSGTIRSWCDPGCGFPARRAGGVADVDRRSELPRLLLLTPVGVETFGPPTGTLLRSARQRMVRPAASDGTGRCVLLERARRGQNRIVRPATGDVYVPHTGAAPPARILLAAHGPLTCPAQTRLVS